MRCKDNEKASKEGFGRLEGRASMTILDLVAVLLERVKTKYH